MRLVVELNLISIRFDYMLICVLRSCQFERTHKVNIHLSDLKK